MMSTRRSCVLLLVTALASSTVTDAADSVSARTQRSQDVHTSHINSVESESDIRLAREWGLRSEEWQRYRALMRGPLGTYSPTLDPLSALGIEARSVEERRRYAELQVASEGRRVEKLLAYQQAYDEAWKRLHPSLLPIKATLPTPRAGLPPSTPTGVPGRLAVFVKAGCTACNTRVQQLQAAGSQFDLYMVGSRQDDARIRAWAAQAGIDAEKVRERTITLNHDAGRWLSIGGQGELPAVVTQVNDKWLRQ